MVGQKFWATGITLLCDGPGWIAEIEFYDPRFNEKNSIGGTLYTRRPQEITSAINLIIADAKKLGIDFQPTRKSVPFLYYFQDGESKDYPPPEGWKDILKKEADRIGFATYSIEEKE